MKKMMLLLAAGFLLVACGGKSGPCPSGATQQVEKKGGEARVVACYDANGLEHGPFAEWWSNGKKEAEGEYRAGKRHGKWTKWQKSGQKHSEGEYRDGKEQGKWTYWHKNGQKTELEYRNGEEHGKKTVWYKNGQKQREGKVQTYHVGKMAAPLPHGKWTHWNEDGSVEKIEHWGDNGKLIKIEQDEKFTYWYENGQKHSEGKYRAGKKHGKWTWWYKDGSVEAVAQYDNGKLEKSEKTEKAGPCPDGATQMDERSCCALEDARGHRVVACYDDKGVMHGPYSERHENGQKHSKGEYRNGKRQGKWTFWEEDGQKDYEVEYRDGEPHGKWTFFHENGQKKSEGEYRDGKEHGKWKSWDDNGKLIKTE